MLPLSVDEWESIRETLFWLSQPRERLAEADGDIARWTHLQRGRDTR